MPGFQVAPNLGDPVGATDLRPFYSYTWRIPHLFGEAGDAGVLIYAKDCTLPTFATGREEVEGASVIYKYASMVNWEDVRLTFYDIPNSDQTLAAKLKEWRDRVWTAEEGLGFADNYKQETNIEVFNLDTTVAYMWNLYGSWPQTIRDGELTYTRSDMKLVEVVVVYDWAQTNSSPAKYISPGDIDSPGYGGSPS